MMRDFPIFYVLLTIHSDIIL